MEVFLSIDTNLEYGMSQKIHDSIRTAISELIKNGTSMKKGSKLAIKINNLGPYSSDTGACTHPAVLKAVIEEFKQPGVSITVYEDCLRDNYVEASGILEVIKETGVEFVNLRDRPYVKVIVNEREYEYSKDILEADYLVTVPKMKTHVLTSYTGAIKLMYGSIIKAQRKMFHQYDDMRDFSDILVDIYSIKLPMLVVLDGIISMDGAGPSHGMPNNSGLLIISNDGVMADYYACKLMKYKPFDIDSIRIAFERKLEQCEADMVKRLGDDSESFHQSFKTIPSLSGKTGKRFRSILIGELKFIEERCTKCRVCIGSCPVNAISMKNYPVTDSAKCINCYCCMELCSEGAYILKNKFQQKGAKTKDAEE
ncbi:MAG TPA: DUF362 domain-containing protein [Mobilitalea sp.]|nr:DUF362 domain-containing protein [Mobilitalea sp.]